MPERNQGKPYSVPDTGVHGCSFRLVDCCYRIDAEQMGVLTREIVLNCGRGVR